VRPPLPAGPLVPGQLVETVIEKGVYRGRGLGRVEGRVLFVPRAHAGDRVLARVTQVHPGWAEGAIEQLIAPSPQRRASPCRYFPRCGGCAYQDLAYEAQLGLKEAVLRESLARAGCPFDGPVSVHPSPERGWRMRAALHFAPGVSGLRLGLRQEGTRRVVDLEECLQLSDAMNAAARLVRDRLASRPAFARAARGLHLLESPTGDALAAVLEANVPPSGVPGLAAAVGDGGGLGGLGVRASRRLHWVRGSPYVEARVLGLLLRTHVESFFQGNRFLLEPLARAVVDAVPRGGRTIDVYAGVGLFSLPLAARGADEVLAVERSAVAAEDARANARANGLANVRVRCEEAEAALATLPASADESIVVDPPRTGLGHAVVEAVAGRGPRAVVYVSCDPPTLGRDLALFAGRGYAPASVQVFDLFPDTFHLEAVVRLVPM
jgi:23S rRNA (uracil1939-C5)-methyltransferase